MSHEASAWAKTFKTGSPARKAVLMVVAEYASEHAETFDGFHGCYPGQDSLAALCEVSVRSLRDHLNELESRGAIRRFERRRPDGYRTTDWLVMPVKSFQAIHPGQGFGEGLALYEGDLGASSVSPGQESPADSAGEIPEPDTLPADSAGDPVDNVEMSDLTGKSEQPHRQLFAGQEPLVEPKEKKPLPTYVPTVPARDGSTPNRGGFRKETIEENRQRRMAAAIAEALERRPDWGPKDITEAFRKCAAAGRPWELAIRALVIVSRMPDTSGPGRIVADGPWWREAAETTVVTVEPRRAPSCGRHPGQYLPCNVCDAEAPLPAAPAEVVEHRLARGRCRHGFVSGSDPVSFKPLCVACRRGIS